MKYVYTLVLLFFLATITRAQRPVEVVPMITTPFPNEFDELLEDYTNYTFTVINYTFSDQEIYFLADLVGDNGITFRTNRDYRPPAPYSLGSRQTAFLTGLDLEDLNEGISGSDIDIEGMSPLQLAQGVIPEGNYQFCINAFDFATGEQLSSGCSFPFFVGSGDVPRIITPFEEEIIPATEIPSFVITWEPPTSDPAQAMNYSYVLKIVDMTEYGDSDIEEVFLDGGVAVHLEYELMGTSYIYNGEGDDPPLIYGHQYGIRVQAIDPMMAIEFENAGYSEIRRFWYGEMGDAFTNSNEPEESQQQQDLPEDCFSRCNPAVPDTMQAITDLGIVTSLKMGHFIIENYDLTATGNTFSGEGEIELNFLNDLRVRVAITNIQVNADGEIMSGYIRGIQDDVGSISDFMQLVQFGQAGSAVELADQAIPAGVSAQIGNYLRDARMISALAGMGEVGLPIGFTEQLQGNEFTLGITDLVLTPRSAKARLVVGTKLSMFDGDNWVMFVADSLCVHPSGFGGEYALSLGADLVLQGESENAFELHLKGGLSGADQACEMVMNCDGLQSVDLAGELLFARNVIVPEMPDGTVGEEKAKAYFQVSLNSTGSQADDGQQEEDDAPPAGSVDGTHWVAGLTMDRFQVPGLKGWSFEITEAWLDMSELQNPEEIAFPANYHTTDQTFTGVWIRNALISPPRGMCEADSTSVEISDLFIDPNLYCSVDAYNLFQLGQGNIGGWAFGIDLFHLDVWNNELLEARMEGEIHMPLLDTSSSILYTGTIGQGEGDSDTQGASPGDGDYTYHFNIAFSENVQYSFMIAEGQINDDSFLDIQFDPDDPEGSFVHAVLHGEMTVSTESFYPEDLPELPADINLPSMEYSFDYHSTDGFNEDGTYIGFASPQKLLAGFPVNLDAFDVGVSMTDANEVAVDFGVQISLSEGQTDLAAGAYFSLVSNLTTTSMFEEMTSADDVGDAIGVMKTLRLDRVVFDSITLDIEMSKLAINGKIAFYNNPLPDGTGRDKGVRGDVQVMLPIDGISGRLTAIFGNIGTPAPQYSADYFPYWYVEGLITFPVGIPLGSTGVGLYGLGGGVGYNMVQTQAPSIAGGEITGESVFEPTYNSFRLKFTAVFGTVPKPDAFNADISFIAQFVDGGLDMIGIEGDGYIMTPLNERNDPQIYVGLDIYMYLGNESRDFSIDGNLDVAINVADGVLVGNMSNPEIPNQMVDATFHASPETFFFYMGEPDMNVYDDDDPRGSAMLNIPGILQAEMKTYMMVGHGIPTALPPLPLPIQNILNNPSGSLGGTASATTAQGDLGGVDYESGAGFAHGSYVSVTSDIDALLLYATLRVYLGYDMNITQRTTNCAQTGDLIGINGWYAEGQAYAGLTGGMGLELKLFGSERQFELFQLAAAIALSGGGPNPFYFTGRASVAYSLLGGKINGTSTFSMMVGERCTPMLDDPFAGINFFEIIEPEEGETDVFVGTALHAKFALPMSEVITIPQPVEDADGVIVDNINLRYRPEVTYSLKRANSSQIIQLQDPMWTDEHAHEEFYILPVSALAPNRNYDLTMSIKAWDYQENRWLRVDGATWSQDTVVRFRTGQLPPDLYDWVTYTVPLPYERFFLQGESGNGRIYFSTSIDESYYFPLTQGDAEYAYYVRFTNLETQNETEVPFSYFENTWSGDYGLSFHIPELENSSIYALQIIRKSPFVFQQIGSGRRDVQEVEIAHLRQDEASTQLNLVNAAPAPPGEQLGPGEFLLYHTYFRTSKFDLLREKLDAATVSSVAYGSANPANFGRKLEVTLSLAEKFEQRDFNTFSPPSSAYQFMEFEPRVRILDLFNKPYHNDHAEPRLDDYRSYYVNDVQNGMFFFPWPDDQMKIEWDGTPIYRIPRANIQTSLSNPLSEDEVNALWQSYISGSQVLFPGSISFSGPITVTDIFTGSTYSYDPNACKIVYDTHFKVSKDRKKVLDWATNYLQTISPYSFQPFSSLFNSNEPAFITRKDQLNDANLKLQNHPGDYALKFSRNISTKPNEELFNIFTMYNLDFNTPTISVSASATATGVLAPNNGYNHYQSFSNGFFNFSNN